MSIKNNIDKIKYTWRHKKALLDIEKKLLGHNTLRGYLHDVDKLIMYCIMPTELAHNIHVLISRHHDQAHTKSDFIQMVIDWECARFTKPDKPLNAADTMRKYYPYLKSEIEPILKELNLI